LYRRSTFTTLAVCSLFLLFGVTASAQVVSLGGARQKITTASAVRARTAPDTSAAEVTRLKLGTVLSADARSAEQAEVGGKKDYWYRVALPGGQQGWVFGALLADYDPARREEAVRRIVEERLKAESMSFDDGVDLYNFVEAALADADVKGTERGELELARLQALNFAATGVGTDMQGRPMKPEFVKAHEREIYNHELAGQWAVKSEAFWELEKKYHGTPLGDRIAWDAANALYPGECESDEVCEFLRLQDTDGRYLSLYPAGAHAAEALQNLKDALASQQLDASLKNKSNDQYARQEREMLRKALAELRAAVSRTNAPGKADVTSRLEQLSPRVVK
jgi:hypothetical protein